MCIRDRIWNLSRRIGEWRGKVMTRILCFSTSDLNTLVHMVCYGLFCNWMVKILLTLYQKLVFIIVEQKRWVNVKVGTPIFLIPVSYTHLTPADERSSVD